MIVLQARLRDGILQSVSLAQTSFTRRYAALNQLSANFLLP